MTSLSKVFLVPFLISSNFLEVSGDLSSSSVAFPFDKVSYFFLSLCHESHLFQVDSVRARGLGGVLVCFGRIVLLCLFFTGGLCPDQPPSFLSLGGILVQPHWGWINVLFLFSLLSFRSVFLFPPCPLLSLKSGSKVSVPFSLLGGMGWPFLACGKVIVYSIFFSAFSYWKIEWGSSSSAGAFSLQGFFIPFTPLVGHFRDEGVLFDSVPFLGFSFPRILNPLFSRWKDFYCSFLGPPGFLLVLSEDVFAPGFLGFFFSLFPWPFWILFFFLVAFPFSVSDVSILVGFFFSKGFFLFLRFSFIRKLIFFGSESRQFFAWSSLVQGQDSFWMEDLHHLKGGVWLRLLQTPLCFPFWAFLSLGFSLFSASRGWTMICVLSCRLGFQRLAQRSWLLEQCFSEGVFWFITLLGLVFEQYLPKKWSVFESFSWISSPGSFLSPGAYSLWTREVGWFSSAFGSLRLFQFACLYGKRLVTMRFWFEDFDVYNHKLGSFL